MTEDERTELLRALKEEVRQPVCTTGKAPAIQIPNNERVSEKKEDTKPRKRHVALDALIVLFMVIAAVAAPIIAYADEGDTKPQIELVSLDEVLADATFDVYKVAGCEYTMTDYGLVQYDLDTLKAAKGMKKKVLGKDYTIEDYFDIARKRAPIKQNMETMTQLAKRVEKAKVKPVGKIVCDAEPISVPGSGVYLFVLEGWEKVDPEDYDWLTTPAFLEIVKGVEEETEDINAPVENYAGQQQLKDEGILGTFLHGMRSYRGALTAIYQPENAPEGVETAVEEEMPEQDEDNGREAGGFVKTLLLGGAITAAALFVLKFLTKRRKPAKNGNSPAEAAKKPDTGSGKGDDTVNTGNEKEAPAGEDLPELGESD